MFTCSKGIIKARLSHGTRIAQGKEIKIKLNTTIAAQVSTFCYLITKIDGEPWLQDPALIEIKHHAKSKLLKKVKIPKEVWTINIPS